MPKTKISEFSATPANNTDIDSINIAEGCAPSGINDAIRELMAQLKDFQVGSAGDPVTVGGVLTVTAGAVGTPAITTAGDTNTGIFFPAADTIAFAEGGAEAMRIDSSGNLGLGVTPAVWNSGYKAIQFSNSGALFGATGDVYLGNNVYSNSSDVNTYITTNSASMYRQTGGQHLWYAASSGTAGTNITFSRPMTLDASGNLCVGTTSSSPITSRISGSANGLIVGGGTFPAVCVQDSTDSTYFSHFSQNNADTYLFNTANGTMRFGTNDTERVRIDSSGKLLVGTTSGGTDKVRFSSNGASENQLGLVSADDSNGNGYIQFRRSDVTSIGSISRVGTTNAVAYNTTSDYRLKTVSGAVTGQGARIDALKPIDYVWTEGGQQARGFLAHEFQSVYLNSVTGTKDAVDADGNPVYQSMQAATSEVIADLVAEIQSLRTRVAQLES